MARLGEWLRLARAHSAAGAALAVWVGARVAGAPWEAWWLLPMAVAWLLSAAGNAFNDAHDVAIDRINRPQRPVARGAISPAAARRFACGCATLALGLALPFGTLSVVGTGTGIGLLFLYTTHLKRVPLVGNVTVGLLTGMALSYGGLLGGDVLTVMLPAATLGLLFGGREILKTIHDLPGDRARGVTTLATALGPRGALLAATGCWGAALALLAAWAATHRAAWPLWALVALASAALVAPPWRTRATPRAVAWSLRWSKGLGLLLLLGLSVG